MSNLKKADIGFKLLLFFSSFFLWVGGGGGGGEGLPANSNRIFFGASNK